MWTEFLWPLIGTHAKHLRTWYSPVRFCKEQVSAWLREQQLPVHWKKEKGYVILKVALK
jgi:hypothetical protein